MESKASFDLLKAFLAINEKYDSDVSILFYVRCGVAKTDAEHEAKIQDLVIILVTSSKDV